MKISQSEAATLLSIIASLTNALGEVGDVVQATVEIRLDPERSVLLAHDEGSEWHIEVYDQPSPSGPKDPDLVDDREEHRPEEMMDAPTTNLAMARQSKG